MIPTQLPPDQCCNPVLLSLLDAYRRSSAGRTGDAKRDFSIRFEKLVHDLAKANVPATAQAGQLLTQLESAGLVRIKRMPLARERFLTIQISPEHEAGLFHACRQAPPTKARNTAAELLQPFIGVLPPHHAHDMTWNAAIEAARAAIATGASPEGLPRSSEKRVDVIRAASAVLQNREPVSLRRLSAVSLGDSKLLEDLRDSVECFLEQILEPDLARLEAWGVSNTPPSLLLSGPLVAELPRGCFNGQVLSCPYSLSLADIERSIRLRVTPAQAQPTRCITIENVAVFQEVAALRTGDLIVHSSYPGRAATSLLRNLPSQIECFHWGDTDPWGFDILRVLRKKSGRPVHALNMKYREGPERPFSTRETAILSRLLADTDMRDVRGELEAMCAAKSKGDFEQESLPPAKGQFPFL